MYENNEVVCESASDEANEQVNKTYNYINEPLISKLNVGACTYIKDLSLHYVLPIKLMIEVGNQIH